jgi:hypothetical protein
MTRIQASTPEAVLNQLDETMLQRSVYRVLGREDVEVICRECVSIYSPNTRITDGVYRLTGVARDHGQDLPWSLVLKITRAPAGQPPGVLPFSRETLAYRSGLLSDLPGVRAPRCYGLEERSDGVAWLWLEDLAERAEAGGSDTRRGQARRWTIDKYAVVAHALGVFNGTYLTTRALPDREFLVKEGFHSTTEATARTFARLAEVHDHPLVRRSTPDDLLPRMRRLFDDRPLLLATLDQLPRVLCHRDLIPSNLFLRRDAGGGLETVIVDWEGVGIEHIGRDIGSLVPAGVHSFDIDPAHLPAIDATAFTAYLQGLRDAGWTGDPRPARVGYAISAALRYGLMVVGILAVDESRRQTLERSFGHPFEEIVDVFVDEQRFIMDLVDEARTLLAEI